MGEFEEACNKGMVDWDIAQRILEEEVGYCHEMDIRGIGEDNHANNAIGESQLEGLQYKLTQCNERCISARNKKITEKEMPWIRKAIQKGILITVTGMSQVE